MEFHGKAGGRDRNHKSQHHTDSISAFKHTSLSCPTAEFLTSFKTKFRHHLPRGFPYHSVLIIPFYSLLLGYLLWASIFPSNTVQ